MNLFSITTEKSGIDIKQRYNDNNNEKNIAFMCPCDTVHYGCLSPGLR